MKVKKTRVKSKLIDTAWNLFLEKGYEQTTVDQIITESGTSKGSFYHHFKGKEDLLFALAYKFDDEYEIWLESEDKNISAIDRLIDFNRYVSTNLEESPFKMFYADLYGLQVRTQFERHILNPGRVYYHIITRLFKEAIENGEIDEHESYDDLCKTFAIMQRGLTYDWCLNMWNYSLLDQSEKIVDTFLLSLRKNKNVVKKEED